ncbi:uncharacterized protein LOC108679875 [Hyalella azteca]|uniref:Uncharacterized protein LOC108679875 n=1 Tax=Hyalella azteca TaxID=294128 RepID=A0A979FR33_HYAAZ|nr:uncharacterized protein LOC108679875 [Hyalella azteca]
MLKCVYFILIASIHSVAAFKVAQSSAGQQSSTAIDSSMSAQSCYDSLEILAGLPLVFDGLKKILCDDDEKALDDAAVEHLSSEIIGASSVPLQREKRQSDTPATDAINRAGLTYLIILLTLTTLLILVKIFSKQLCFVWNLLPNFRNRPTDPVVVIEENIEQVVVEPVSFIPRLEIFCDLSKKQGCLTVVPNVISKEHVTYDIEDEQTYFDIKVNLHKGYFRNTKKREVIPMHGYYFMDLKNIIQELLYSKDEAQSRLIEALQDQTATNSKSIIDAAIAHPTPKPPPDTDSDDTLPYISMGRILQIPKVKGRQILTVVNETLTRSWAGLVPPRTFELHSPVEEERSDGRSASLGYVTGSSGVSVETTPKEDLSTESSLENIVLDERELNENVQLRDALKYKLYNNGEDSNGTGILQNENAEKRAANLLEDVSCNKLKEDLLTSNSEIGVEAVSSFQDCPHDSSSHVSQQESPAAQDDSATVLPAGRVSSSEAATTAAAGPSLNQAAPGEVESLATSDVRKFSSAEVENLDATRE